MMQRCLGFFATKVVQRRWTVTLTMLILTLVLVGGVGQLTITIDPDQTLPQTHPYQITTNLVDRVFGNKFAVLIGLTPREGDALQPKVLTAVQAITNALARDPGVVTANIASITAPKVKDISGTEDDLKVTQFASEFPLTEAGHAGLSDAINRNPVYKGLLISEDKRTTAVVADFRKDPDGFRAIARRVEQIVAPWRSPDLSVEVTGQPILLAMTEVYSDRIFILFPLALLVVGLIHFEAFRSWQGLVLPLVTGLVATIWALGFMGWTHTSLDAFNASTPILILAVSAGHAVQILKRYYEEFDRLLSEEQVDAAAASREAIVRTIELTGPVMIAAGLTAALSFASLIVFQITTIRIFGLFTAAGITSALIIELTLIPALRAILPPPRLKRVQRETKIGVWDAVIESAVRVCLAHPIRVLAATSVFLVVLILGSMQVRVDNALRSYFLPSSRLRVEDSNLNKRLAGSNVLSVVVVGTKDDEIKSPAVLDAIEATQRFLEQEPDIGKTVSLVDFVRQIDVVLNPGADAHWRIPRDPNLISQYLLLYSMSGSPGDFDAYVDAGYRRAVITAYVKNESSAYLEKLAERVGEFTARTFPKDVSVQIGGSVMSSVALNQVLVSNKLINIGQIGCVVFIISAVLFRSLIGGLLVLMPLALAVAANFGVMGWFGIPLQVATATVSAMAVGIGADYAIYMLYRLREEAILNEPATAIARTLRSAGKAVMFVSTAIAGGYAVMMSSWGFMIHFWLGLLISLAMLVSAAASTLTLPALVLKVRPKFLFHDAPSSLEGPSSQVRRAITLSAIMAVSTRLTMGSARAQSSSADEVMRRNFVATKVADSVSDVTFTLISSDGLERQRHLRNWTKLEEDGVSNMRLARFLSPPDVRGTATLTIESRSSDDDIWIYLPALKRVRRLLSSNKKDSYVGTDFSYGDFIGWKVEDWHHSIVRQEVIDGSMCYVINSLPVAPAAVESSGYSRRLQWIRADNFITVRGQFFDIDGRLWKSYAASDLRAIDPARNRWQPMHLETHDELTNHRTIIVLENFRTNQGLDLALFNPRALDQER